MRLGILADVHANIDALEAVVRDGNGLVERWWFLGDALGRGPFPVETLQRLREMVQLVQWRMGNHDLYVTGALTADGVSQADRFTYADHRRQLQAFRPTGRAALWAWCRRSWQLRRATPIRLAHRCG